MRKVIVGDMLGGTNKGEKDRAGYCEHVGGREQVK